MVGTWKMSRRQRSIHISSKMGILFRFGYGVGKGEGSHNFLEGKYSYFSLWGR